VDVGLEHGSDVALGVAAAPQGATSPGPVQADDTALCHPDVQTWG